jgi:hypothetical protein
MAGGIICYAMRYLPWAFLLAAGTALMGCSSSPDAPINQTTPIRQMDHFFESMSGPDTPGVDDPGVAHRESGYAPAYPPYQR